MRKHNPLSNQEGFTLVEIIAVLIILGILAAVAVPRYIDLEANAKLRAVDAAVSELNGRESLTWADVKISSTGYLPATGDDDVWDRLVDPTEPVESRIPLGDDYKWTAAPTQTGASSFIFKGETFNVSRRASTRNQPGAWTKQ